MHFLLCIKQGAGRSAQEVEDEHAQVSSSSSSSSHFMLICCAREFLLCSLHATSTLFCIHNHCKVGHSAPKPTLMWSVRLHLHALQQHLLATTSMGTSLMSFARHCLSSLAKFTPSQRQMPKSSWLPFGLKRKWTTRSTDHSTLSWWHRTQLVLIDLYFFFCCVAVAPLGVFLFYLTW